ncbi:MAG: response regulator [Vicinamibacterales bacterium]|nr:response regulator [Vicinamibacterales bacterium]
MTILLGDSWRRTVLVVEDALTTRCILEKFFGRAGCNVVQAPDPDTALKRLKTTPIDAVILDLYLAHHRSGLEVLEQMRLEERYSNIPVVILTGADEVASTERAIIRRHGAFLLYKRLGFQEVVNRLEQIITPAAA